LMLPLPCKAARAWEAIALLGLISSAWVYRVTAASGLPVVVVVVVVVRVVVVGGGGGGGVVMRFER